MKAVRSLIALSLLVTTSSWAAQPNSQEEDPHHPASAASAPTSKTPGVKPAATQPSASKPSAATGQNMVQMDKQMMMMGEMHQKMMNAKTPEERGALMGEHMKMMQEGMSMMNMMGGSGMGGPGMGGTQGGKGAAGSMEDRQKMMEKRMDMMQMMMQMMMDAQPAPAMK
ncbi:MAG: hypothetical protein KGL73_01390 [Burkholderiales bacterium]|nr:hypothetical protein [Burkholderiales bacterium]